MFSVRVLRQAIRDITILPKDYARLISQHIDHLTENPRPRDSKKLKGEATYSLRVGVYRVLYDIDDSAKVVTIYRIKHRREAYR